MPGDGSLSRARVDPASYQLYRQRVASPRPGSDFSPWTGVCTVSSASGIALASRGFRLLLFYVDTDQRTILVRKSTDYGATFGSGSGLACRSHQRQRRCISVLFRGRHGLRRQEDRWELGLSFRLD